MSRIWKNSDELWTWQARYEPIYTIYMCVYISRAMGSRPSSLKFGSCLCIARILCTWYHFCWVEWIWNCLYRGELFRRPSVPSPIDPRSVCITLHRPEMLSLSNRRDPSLCVSDGYFSGHLCRIRWSSWSSVSSRIEPDLPVLRRAEWTIVC